MAHAGITAGIPTAAPPATDEAVRDVEILSQLMELGLEFARALQTQGVAAAKAGDLDRACAAEARFSSLALGIRRAIALKAKLREQQQGGEDVAWHSRQLPDDKTLRRQSVAQAVGRAIAATPDAEARERLTADLWTRLLEDGRIDADLADRALPIGALILSLCRSLGIPPDRAAPDGRTAAVTTPAAGSAVPDSTRLTEHTPPGRSFGHFRGIAAEDVGGPEGERYVHDLATGEIFGPKGKLIRTLPVEPPSPGAAGPPPGTAPPDPGPSTATGPNAAAPKPGAG